MNIKSNNEDTKIRGAGVMQKSHIIVKGYSERNITVTVDEEAMRETTRETYATGIRVIEYNNKGAYWYDVK